MNDDIRQDQQDTESTNRDQAQGAMTEAKGRLEESAGALTGNTRMKAQGEADQMAGAATRKKGQWKQRLISWINRL
jgi:uncharacterized protein YjbJ (UPF0337 family)